MKSVTCTIHNPLVKVEKKYDALFEKYALNPPAAGLLWEVRYALCVHYIPTIQKIYRQSQHTAPLASAVPSGLTKSRVAPSRRSDRVNASNESYTCKLLVQKHHLSVLLSVHDLGFIL